MSRPTMKRGFTLIELMLVVAILSILATVSIPAFRTMSFKAKAAERGSVLHGLRNSIATYWAKDGTFGGGTTTAPWNPGLPATPADAMGRRVFNPMAAVWSKLDLNVEGALFYSYRFTTDESGTPYFYTIEVQGDIDGNGEDYYRMYEWDQDSTGAYHQITPDPDFMYESTVF